MARLVFGMNQSLDGYVDHEAFAPDPVLFGHFIAEAEAQSVSLYGRKVYQLMRYWEEDRPEWGAPERAFAAAWQRQKKWVVSRSGVEVGPNAALVTGDLAEAVQALKAREAGEIEVAGPDLAASLTALGLIDEYRIYLHPVVLGSGTPFFKATRPRLRLEDCSQIGEDVLRLVYLPE